MEKIGLTIVGVIALVIFGVFLPIWLAVPLSFIYGIAHNHTKNIIEKRNKQND